VLLTTEVPPDRIKTAWEPAGVRAGEQVKGPAEVREKAPDRAVAGNFKKSANQPLNLSAIVHSEMVNFDSDQGLSVFATAGIAQRIR
jgi:hypothetical protein